MALPKSARTIIVADRTFAWMFKGYGGKQPSHQEGSPPSARVIVQEKIDRPGSPLIVDIQSKRWISQDVHDMDTGHVMHRAAFTPKDARKLIETALDAGWETRCRVKGPYRFSPTIDPIDFTDYTTAPWKDIPTPPDPGWRPGQ